MPWTINELSEVATLVLAGDKIVNDGGVVSGPGVGTTGVGLGGVGLDNRLRGIVRLRVTRLSSESRAERVMTLSPMVNGTVGIVQLADPCAVPETPVLVVQLTCTAP